MEQFEIPAYIKAVIEDQNLLLTTTIRKRITTMIAKSLFTLSYFAGTERLQFDKVWHEQIITLTSFLRKLTSPDPSKPPIEERDKLEIAGELIKIGLDYYTNAFKNTKVFKSKIDDVKELITTINEITQMERAEKKYSKLYSLRKQMIFPPDLERSGGDDDYRSYCVLCFKWYFDKDKKVSIQKIRHHKDCYCIKNNLQLTTCTLEPRNKTR